MTLNIWVFGKKVTLKHSLQNFIKEALLFLLMMINRTENNIRQQRWGNKVLLNVYTYLKETGKNAKDLKK